MTQNPRKGIKQKVEHGIPCYIDDSKKAVDLHRSHGLCNNYLEGGGGVGKLKGGHRRKWQQGKGGLDAKFNTYRGGALLFHSFLQTGKVVEELLEFKY